VEFILLYTQRRAEPYAWVPALVALKSRKNPLSGIATTLAEGRAAAQESA
jgi:hypothetical protein